MTYAQITQKNYHCHVEFLTSDITRTRTKTIFISKISLFLTSDFSPVSMQDVHQLEQQFTPDLQPHTVHQELPPVSHRTSPQCQVSVSQTIIRLSLI